MSASQALEDIAAKVNALFSRDAATQALKDELSGLKAEAADLKSKLTACEAERDSLKASITAKDAEVSAAKAEADKHGAALIAANEAKAAEVAAAVSAKDAAETALKDLQANPSKQAVAIAAKAGVKATDLPKGSVADNETKPQLKGLARTFAAFQAESASKTKKH